jgi:hypothetical protein
MAKLGLWRKIDLIGAATDADRREQQTKGGGGSASADHGARTNRVEELSP